ncbi:MAG: cobalamin-dependent protein, partial [Alphaproteobacteria bacterium]|nr:cobalamin-dependent protein [Alphaproteobacteria bacterium]
QILAFETDLLEYGDIFDGSREIEAKVAELKQQARAELATIDAMGGAVAAIDYMKRGLVESNTARLRDIERGDQTVIGVNAFVETEPSPLSAGGLSIQTVDESVEADQIESLNAWRAARDAATVEQALNGLEGAAREGRNIMEPSIECARAGVTTGEWGEVLRRVFGEYRAPTGVGAATSGSTDDLTEIRRKANEAAVSLGRRIKFLVGKPGLDGHSNGAEQIAVRARDCGMDVLYEGIRLTPAQITRAAVDESVHVIGLSILSGSHVPLVRDIMERLNADGAGDIPVVVGGIIPPEDAEKLKQLGVAAVYTPKNFQLNAIMKDIIALANRNA